jgi:hypothetical protein
MQWCVAASVDTGQERCNEALLVLSVSSENQGMKSRGHTERTKPTSSDPPKYTWAMLLKDLLLHTRQMLRNRGQVRFKTISQSRVNLWVHGYHNNTRFQQLRGIFIEHHQLVFGGHFFSKHFCRDTFVGTPFQDGV